MTYPILIDEYYDENEGTFSNTECVLSNCAECVVTESFTDFTLDAKFNDFPDYIYTPEIDDIIRITYSDGNDYEFRIKSLKYTDGMWSVNARYRAEDLDGCYTKPQKGMYTPKALMNTLFDTSNMYGYNDGSTSYYSRSSVSSEDESFLIPYYLETPSSVRSVLYNEIVGMTGYEFKPTNVRNLEILKRRGSALPKILAYGKNITSFSFEQSETDLPCGIVAYWKSSGSLVSWMHASSFCKSCSAELYDASSEFSVSYPPWSDDEMISTADYQYSRSNPSHRQLDTTFVAGLSPETKDIQIGDTVYIDYERIGLGIFSFMQDGKYYGYRVTKLSYDVLNEFVSEVTVGDTKKDVSDLIANHRNNSAKKEYSIDEWSISNSDWNENNEYTFNSGYTLSGKNVELDAYIYGMSGVDIVTRYNIKVKAISGSNITVVCDDKPEDDVSISIAVY